MVNPRGKARSGSRSGTRSKARHPAFPRWLLLAVGLGLAGLALYAMVARGPSQNVGRSPEEIDDDSRARLESVLRDAEERDERSGP